MASPLVLQSQVPDLPLEILSMFVRFSSRSTLLSWSRVNKFVHREATFNLYRWLELNQNGEKLKACLNTLLASKKAKADADADPTKAAKPIDLTKLVQVVITDYQRNAFCPGFTFEVYGADVAALIKMCPNVKHLDLNVAAIDTLRRLIPGNIPVGTTDVSPEIITLSTRDLAASPVIAELVNIQPSLTKIWIRSLLISLSPAIEQHHSRTLRWEINDDVELQFDLDALDTMLECMKPTLGRIRGDMTRPGVEWQNIFEKLLTFQGYLSLVLPGGAALNELCNRLKAGMKEPTLGELGQYKVIEWYGGKC
ncbi:hypothetical protein Hypma_010940 [Hypsizygus marmoreus]|uniref:Uncharacterized protein n=1 Tax=Hypsizygus marmoreus TaxID=39966 RepID=A0A369JKC7_HYPMA|nr:hypothetical protein Hypma_010940 [Hypsizygus marmoreus]